MYISFDFRGLEHHFFGQENKNVTLYKDFKLIGLEHHFFGQGTTENG